MSIEEDVELRDLLTQTLETNGSLAKIRAQLRACVFLALDEDELIQKKAPLINHKIKKSIQTSEGKLMFCIIREFLEYFNLDNTLAVYEPESYLGTEYDYNGRNQIIKDLNLDCNESVPLLLQLIQIAQKKTCNDVNNAHLKFNNVETLNGLNNASIEIPKLELVSAKDAILNETFDLSSPTIEQNDDKVDSTRSHTSTNSKDGTYEGTSSIAEDSIKDKLLIDFDKSIQISESHNKIDAPRSLLDATLIESDYVAPILKETKISPQKLDKFKGKTSMTSLADLPSLPSLLYKDIEFKEKTNLKEIYMDFDNYEEDFMSGSNFELSDNFKSPKQLKHNVDKIVKAEKVLINKERNDSVASSVTSEEFELSSNVDDILKSNSN